MPRSIRVAHDGSWTKLLTQIIGSLTAGMARVRLERLAQGRDDGCGQSAAYASTARGYEAATEVRQRMRRMDQLAQGESIPIRCARP